MPTILTSIIIAILIIVFIFFVVPRLIVFAISLVVIYFIFMSAFIWSTDEIMDVLKTEKWMNPNKQEVVSNGLNYIKENQPDDVVIDPKVIHKTFEEKKDYYLSKEGKEELKNSWLNMIEKLTDEEKKQFVKENIEVLEEVFTKKELDSL